MPNHCHNDLWISGSSEDVDKLLAHIGADKETPEFDFNTVLPYPEKFALMDKEAQERRTPEDGEAYRSKWGTDSDGYNSGGYEWCHQAWGTKWNAYDVVRRDYEGICLTFQTAWCPPQPVIVALAKMFPTVTLTLEFFERGGAFAGGFSCQSEDDWYDDDDVWEAGKVVDEWEAEYKGPRGG